MQINLRKLIADLLLTFTRDNKLIEMIRMLTCQASVAFNEFNLQVPDWRYKAKANASVLSLEHHIKRELDVDAVITELDGKPIDFLVTIRGFVDENRLRVLIDDYKLAGKSYVFTTGNEVFTAKFSNWYCENLFADNLLTVHFDTNHVWATSAMNVTSQVTVSIYVVYSGGKTQNKQVTIANGTSESNHLTITDSNLFITISEAAITAVSPAQDTYYNYTH